MEYSRSSLFSTGTIDEINLDECTDAEFFDYFNKLEDMLKEFTLENRFLLKYIEKLASSEEYADVMKFLDQLIIKPKTLANPSQTRSGLSLGSDKYRKRRLISPFMKTEILCHIMEESQDNFTNYLTNSIKIRDQQKAENEEAKITGMEMQIALNNFEHGVVIEGYDTLTQRIPAEKFIRFIDDWMKKAQMTTQKLILHTGAEQLILKKMKNQYVERARLAENMHSVDYDQVIIENKNLQTKLANTVMHIKKLKTINGWANVTVNSQRNSLRVQKIRMDELKQKIKNALQYIENLKAEAKKVELDKQEVYEQYCSQKKLMETYSVPDTLEYVKLKAQLMECKKNLNICMRRNSILNITISACVVQMKNYVKSKKVKAEWFRDPYESSDK